MASCCWLLSAAASFSDCTSLLPLLDCLHLSLGLVFFHFAPFITSYYSLPRLAFDPTRQQPGAADPVSKNITQTQLFFLLLLPQQHA